MFLKILSFLKQPSTIRGLILIGSLVGLNITEDMQEIIIQATIVLYGAVNIIRDESKGVNQ